MTQLQASYILDGIRTYIDKHSHSQEFYALFEQLSYFDADFSSPNLKVSHPNLSLAAVYNNIVSRGLPTKASVFVEEKFARLTGLTEKNNTPPDQIKYQLKENYLSEEFFRALHIIEPSIQKTHFELKDPHHQKLLELYIDKTLGEFAWQVFAHQQNLATALQFAPNAESKLILNNIDYEFVPKEQHVSVAIPYGQFKGLLLKLSQDNTNLSYSHTRNEQEEKIAGALNQKWIDFKINATESQNSSATRELSTHTATKYFNTLSKNYKIPLAGYAQGRTALDIALAPIFIARLQKVLAQLMIANKLDLRAKKWTIAVIERDVSASFLAIEDFKQSMNALLALVANKTSMPEIELFVYSNPNFKSGKLNHGFKTQINNLDDFPTTKTFDLLIDISMLRRSGLPEKKQRNRAKEMVVVRSANFIESHNQMAYAKPITYLNGNSNEISQLQQMAAQNLLQHLFRKKSFLPNQNLAIYSVLSRKNTLVNTPPHTGKSLVYQYSALLQPAISVIIHPNMALMKNQFDQIAHTQIGSLMFSNSYKRNQYQKQEALDKLERGQIIFAFLSTEMLKSADVQAKLKALKQNKISIATLVVDEAHNLSPWSDNFKVLDHRLTNYVLPHLQRGHQLQTIALSSTLSYNHKADVTSELNIEQTITAAYRDTHNTSFEIARQGKPDYNYNTPENKILAQSLANRLGALEQIYQKKKAPANDERAMIITPNYLSDDFEAFHHQLKQILDEAPVFYGSMSYDNLHLDGKKAHDSKNVIENFTAGNGKIIIANEIISQGMDIDGLKNIIYTGLPSSIDQLYRAAGRVGRKMSDKHIEIPYFEIQSYIKETAINIFQDGSYVQKKAKTDTTPDIAYAQQRIQLQYKGLKKEWTILSELLQQIEAAPRDVGQELKQILNDEFDISLHLDTEPQINPYQLYFFDGKSDIGYIDYKNHKIQTTAQSYKANWAQKILDFAANEIATRFKKPEQIFDYLEKNAEAQKLPGIFETLQLGQHSVEIPFENNGLFELANFLNENANLQVTPNQLEKIYILAANQFELFAALSHQFNINQNLQESIAIYYHKIRIFEDTALAIQRLESIGLIQKYILDHNKRIFLISLNHQPGTKKLLGTFLSRHFTDNYVEQALKLTNTSTLTDEILSALKLFLEVFYTKIFVARMNAAALVHSMAYHLSKTTKTKQQRKQDLNQIFRSYFSAKYTSELYSPNLLTESQYFKTKKIDFISEVIQWTGNERDNWLHLKNSCILLLKQYKNNYHLLLLYAVSGFICAQNSTEKAEYAQQMAIGLEVMGIQNNMNLQKQYQYMAGLLRVIFDKNKALKNQIEPIIWLKTQNRWLSNFNQQFLKGYKQQ